MDLTSHTIPEDQLAAVFGQSSQGVSLRERAITSANVYVRGQVQLTLDNPQARGWRLTATEALSTFGWTTLRSVHDDGAYTLVSDRFEPARTLKNARKTLGLTVAQVASRSGVPSDVVERSEIVGNLTPIADLRLIGQTLALDSLSLSFEPGAKGDGDLGVRLRESFGQKDSAKFSPRSVMDLAEAGWVIYEQSRLQRDLDLPPHAVVYGDLYGRDDDYSYPTHQHGYRLAARTREILHLGFAPIKNLRSLVEDVIGIPLVQQEMDGRFAGATISIDGKRGIVVNVTGANQNVWVRRMTLCHELGHLMWDPEQFLNSLRVDDYTTINSDAYGYGSDEVEMRANAFAVAFLAPPEGVKAALEGISDAKDAIRIVTDTFGISVTAARNHITNVMKWDIRTAKVNGSFEPSDEWVSAENYTLDWFPLKTTSSSRRGKFAWMAAMAHKGKLISIDTVSFYMKSSIEETTSALNHLEGLWASS